MFMKNGNDRRSSDPLRKDARRITIFEVLWATFSLVGGLVVGAYLTDVFAFYGIRLFGKIGEVIGSVLGLLGGLVIAGILSWLLIGAVITVIVRVLDYRDGSG